MKREEALLKELGLWPTIFLSGVPTSVEGSVKSKQVSLTQEPTSETVSISQKTISKLVENQVPVASQEHKTMASLFDRVQACRACVLGEIRRQAVLERGGERASWFFVAQAPGVEEELHSQALFGELGVLTEQLLQAIEVKPYQDTFHTYMVKCRPTHNRPPTPDEFEHCQSFLFEQIDRLKPQVIVLLGRHVAKLLLHIDGSMADLRQKTYQFRGVSTFVTQDFATLLRQPQEKGRVWRDLMFVKEHVDMVSIPSESE